MLSQSTIDQYADMSLTELREESRHYHEEWKRADNPIRAAHAREDTILFADLIAERISNCLQLKPTPTLTP